MHALHTYFKYNRKFVETLEIIVFYYNQLNYHHNR